MQDVLNTNGLLSPVQNLKLLHSGIAHIPISRFCYVLSNKDIDELKTYVKEITFDPGKAKYQVQHLLLLYIASITYIVMSFDENDYLDDDLIISCDNLAKALYSFYKDVNTLLWTRQIEIQCKSYNKLQQVAKKVPSKTSKIETMSRNKILYELRKISNRISGIY
jgi:hypothetical protein